MLLMRTVTFLVLEGVDKGRVFRDLPVPCTIGREEGNALRLNDERISRYHAKIQFEDGDVIITDLDSTNGTRVNNTTVQIRRLRAGDQVSVGRTMLLFGTMEEIAARKAQINAPLLTGNSQTMRLDELAAELNRGSQTISPNRGERESGRWSPAESEMPPLPNKLTGSQSARLAEVFDHLHRGLTGAVENIDANEDGTEIRLGFAEWQTIQAVQLLLARYVRLIGEPGE
jgi:hypothetical protein